MKSESEIREEIKKTEDRLRYMNFEEPVWDRLASKVRTLKWVLGEEEKGE